AVKVDIAFSTMHFFFFSSRRRHTRFSRDWSSDVCSSDLRLARGVTERVPDRRLPATLGGSAFDLVRRRRGTPQESVRKHQSIRRSEERRVGKECKSRRSRYA